MKIFFATEIVKLFSYGCLKFSIRKKSNFFFSFSPPKAKEISCQAISHSICDFLTLTWTQPGISAISTYNPNRN